MAEEAAAARVRELEAEVAELRKVEEAATYAHSQLSKCFDGEGSCDLVYAERAYFKLKAAL